MKTIALVFGALACGGAGDRRSDSFDGFRTRSGACARARWSIEPISPGTWRPNQLVVDSQTAAGDLADFGGIPLNDAARLYALSWPASRQTVKQHQCMGYVTPYFWYAPGNYRIWEERDPFTQRLTAWRFYGQIAQGDRTVYMDGRPHPPAYAPHTFAGFSTGEYQGNVLTVTTTHLKRGWIKANGVPQSDAATVARTLHPARRCRYGAGCD